MGIVQDPINLPRSFSQNLCEIHLSAVSFFLVEFLVAYTVNQIPNNLNLMNLVADGYFQ